MSEDILHIHCPNSRRIIQRYLNECRSERRPYIFFTDTMTLTGGEAERQNGGEAERQNGGKAERQRGGKAERRKGGEAERQQATGALSECANTPLNSKLSTLNLILVPVSFLEEETYKSEICTYLARKTGAHIILLQAHDYGHKAQNNVNRIITHIEQVKERTGEKISYEVVMAKKDSFGLMKEAVERQREFGNDLLILTASRDYGLDDLFFGPPEQHAIARSRVPVMLVNPRADLFSLCD